MRVQVIVNEKSAEIKYSSKKSNALTKSVFFQLISEKKISLKQVSTKPLRLAIVPVGGDLDEICSAKATALLRATDPAIQAVTFDAGEVALWVGNTYITDDQKKSLLMTVKIQQYNEFEQLLRQGLRQQELQMPAHSLPIWQIEDLLSSAQNNDTYKPLLTDEAKNWFNQKYNGQEAAGNRNHLCKMTGGIPNTVIHSPKAQFIDGKPQGKTDFNLRRFIFG